MFKAWKKTSHTNSQMRVCIHIIPVQQTKIWRRFFHFTRRKEIHNHCIFFLNLQFTKISSVLQSGFEKSTFYSFFSFKVCLVPHKAKCCWENMESGASYVNGVSILSASILISLTYCKVIPIVFRPFLLIYNCLQ
jgi:hypothetical protein